MWEIMQTIEGIHSETSPEVQNMGISGHPKRTLKKEKDYKHLVIQNIA